MKLEMRQNQNFRNLLSYAVRALYTNFVLLFLSTIFRL